MNKLFEAFANIFRVPDLRKRVLFTLALLAVYRLGSHIPTPGIHLERWTEFFNRSSGTIFGFFDLFAGGNIRRLTVFALGIMPYITASIILQLLTVVVPTLEKLQKEGELGTAQDHPVDPLSHGRPLHHAVVRHRRRPAEHAGRHRDQSRVRLHRDDDPLADDRHGVHHVAGRADQRTRHRQRHVADHLYRHRGRPAAPRSATSIRTFSSPTNGAP